MFLPWHALPHLSQEILRNIFTVLSREVRERKHWRIMKSKGLTEDKAIPYSSLRGRFEGSINAKWLLLYLMPQTDTTFHILMCIFPRNPPRCSFSIIFTTDTQDGWGRLETVIFGEIKREFSGMEKLSDLSTITQGGTQGEKPSPLTPLILSHFTYISQYNSLGAVPPSSLPCSSARAANFSFLDEQYTFQGYQNKQLKEPWPLSQNKI